MKLILDDRRPMPNGPYNCVRTYEECVEFLRLFRTISFISLDYDLGAKETGLDVLVYMHENGISPSHINIHSDHKLGVPQMQKYAEEHFPKVRLTFNPLT